MPQASGGTESVLSFAAARGCVEGHAASLQPSGTEPAKILQSVGRVLAENIVADRDYPPFPRATRDGYAVRAADLAQLPAKLRLLGQVRAGDVFDRPVRTGECVEIMTGAPAPDGADVVVMVEHTSTASGMVEIMRAVSKGENIVPKGSEGRAGQKCAQCRPERAYLGLSDRRQVA